MTGIIDVHTHILPGIDDGARDWDESRRMLETAYSQGIRHIVATPHYSRRGLRPEIYELSARLTEEAKKIAPDFKTGLGQETYYHEGLVENLKQGQALTLEGTRCVLVEFDPQEAYHSLYQAVRKMTMARYIPVIAHVERYFCLREGKNLEELVQCGCRLQMNYSSLDGRCGGAAGRSWKEGFIYWARTCTGWITGSRMSGQALDGWKNMWGNRH